MFDLTEGRWLFEPKHHAISAAKVQIVTEPHTDFWQRTYYGFRNDNAPSLLFDTTHNFTFTIKTEFQYRELFDQSGIVIYLDSENWFKASIEFENGQYSRLGSVVTNNGYSDWATTDIPLTTSMWYRLSRRGPDFLVETSVDGKAFEQMRIFHLHKLGDTTLQMGTAQPPLNAEFPVRFGIYACSPSASSFEATFSQPTFETCLWRAHGK